MSNEQYRNTVNLLKAGLVKAKKRLAKTKGTALEALDAQTVRNYEKALKEFQEVCQPD